MTDVINIFVSDSAGSTESSGRKVKKKPPAVNIDANHLLTNTPKRRVAGGNIPSATSLGFVFNK